MHPRRSLSLLHAVVVISIVAARRRVRARCRAARRGRPDGRPRRRVATTAADADRGRRPPRSPPDQVTGELTVFDWSGYEAEGFWQDFKDKYANVDVSFPAMGGSDADIYNGIKTGTNTSDVFHPYTGWLQFYVDEGLVGRDRHDQAQELGQGAG